MTVQDPVCGMKFAKRQSAAETDYDGRTYYFCTEHCKEVFQQDPDRFVVADEDNWRSLNGYVADPGPRPSSSDVV